MNLPSFSAWVARDEEAAVAYIKKLMSENFHQQIAYTVDLVRQLHGHIDQATKERGEYSWGELALFMEQAQEFAPLPEHRVAELDEFFQQLNRQISDAKEENNLSDEDLQKLRTFLSSSGAKFGLYETLELKPIWNANWGIHREKLQKLEDNSVMHAFNCAVLKQRIVKAKKEQKNVENIFKRLYKGFISKLTQEKQADTQTSPEQLQSNPFNLCNKSKDNIHKMKEHTKSKETGKRLGVKFSFADVKKDERCKVKLRE